MKKTSVIETLSTFDDEFDAEALIERLLFIEKVEKGVDDVRKKRIISFDDAKRILLISGKSILPFKTQFFVY